MVNEIKLDKPNSVLSTQTQGNKSKKASSTKTEQDIEVSPSLGYLAQLIQSDEVEGPEQTQRLEAVKTRINNKNYSFDLDALTNKLLKLFNLAK